jgi:transposase
VNRRYEITDDEWEQLRPLLPPMAPKRGGRWRDHRQVLGRPPVPDRQRHPVAGPARALRAVGDGLQAVSKRFARWERDGTWARIEAHLPTAADGAEQLDWAAQIDATVVRAHQHAAGARNGGWTRTTQRAGRRSAGHAAG